MNGMKTKTGIINTILLTLTMVLTPAANALAADYAAGDAAVRSMNGDAKQYLLPGDTVSAYNSLNVNAMDGSSVYTEEPEDPASSVWTNDQETGTVYSIDAQQTVLDDGVTTANSVTLSAAGYEVTVYDGTFDQTTDFVPVFSLNGDESNEVHAWFAPGATFKLIANPAPDGQQFIGWTIDDVHADQPQATFGETAEDGTTTVTLSAALAEPVVIRATYTAAAQQAATPETDTQDTSSDPSAADAGQPETGTADPSASADYSVVIAPNDLGLVPDVTYYDENWEWMTPASDENGNSTVPAGTYVYVQAQAAPEGYTFGNITVTDANGAGVQYGYVNEGDASFIYFTMPETSVTVTTTYTAAAPEETGSTAQADSTEAAETQTESTEAVEVQTESTEAQPESTEALTAAVVPTESTEAQPESTEAQTAPETQNSTEAQTETEITVQTLDAFTKNKHKVTPGEGVSVDKTEAEAGDKITATVSAGDGTSVAWTITDADGNEITPESADNSTAVFTMPAADVTVTAVSSVNSHKVTINGNGTVNGGSASEDVPYGSTVTITASVGSSKEFKGWSVDQGTVILADASKSETTFTMPDEDVALSFSEADVLYKISTDSHITIDDGRNSVPQGTTITVTAEEAGRGYQLDGVAVSDNSVSVSSLGSRKYSFIMPANDVTVTASYSELPGYAVTVTSGKAVNDYSDNKFYAGDNVTITANDPQAGYRFKEWKVTSGNVTLEDTTSDVTTFTMPAANVQLEAVYEKITYKLTVNNGDGDGEYTAGTKVNLTADWPADGKEFSSWKVTSGTANVSSSDRFYAVITMPAQDVTVEAVYKDGPSADNNYIDGITQNQECLKNSAITFTAVGDGMGNTNPNPGDYRYRPTGYAIGNVNGSYNNSSYKTTMSISTTGKYTLTVNFTKDVYKDGSWVSDGSTVSRTVTFNVVDALSVKTGDTNPILPLVIVTAAALAVIIILVVVKARSKKRNR